MTEPRPVPPAAGPAPSRRCSPRTRSGSAWTRGCCWCTRSARWSGSCRRSSGSLVAGAASRGGPWQLLGIGLPVVLGLLRYLTTRFRVRAGRIELRRGLLSRHVLSTPLDRVRTVDLTASPVHRVLGLTTVGVGTGTASTRDDDASTSTGCPRRGPGRCAPSCCRQHGGRPSPAAATAAPAPRPWR